jgi:alpha-glucosidase
MLTSLCLTSEGRRLHAAIAALALVFGLAAAAAAQTLAHPGWAGNGVTLEPWWRRAVFYRIDPAAFQASGSATTGDLNGLRTRLPYIQSLGADAVILDTSALASPDGLDDLARAAVDAHLRVLVELGAPASQSADDDARYLALARAWLNQGAAGLYIPTAQLARVDGAGHIANLLHALRTLTNSFPGNRVLLADTAPASDTGGQDQDLLHALARETQLTAGLPIRTGNPEVSALRTQIERELGVPSADAAPDTTSSPKRTSAHHAANTASPSNSSANLLLVAGRVPKLADDAQQAAMQRTVAAMLLASRAAVILNYGEELGLLPAADGSAPRMQWTPTNLAPAPAPPPPPPATTPSTGTTQPAYGTFKPLIPPLPLTMFPPLRRPEIFVTDDPLPVALPPDRQPGFTAGDVLDPALTAPNAATANVALEDLDDASLLHFYRRLIQLHHDNDTLRNGAETVLDRDADGVLMWLRHAPAGAVTVKDVAVICNLSARPFTLDLAALHLRSGTARKLLSSSPNQTGNQIAPGSVYVGEVR